MQKQSKKRKLEKIKDALAPEKAVVANLSRIVDRIDNNQNELREIKDSLLIAIEKNKVVSVDNLQEQKEFPKDISINNLKDIEFPESIKEVSVNNLKDIEFPQEIKVTNIQEIDQDHKPKWIDTMVEGFFVILSGLLNKITSKTFTVKTSEESRLKPQMVMFINPQTGRPESVQTHIHNASGGLGGPNAVYLRDKSGEKINPATDESILDSLDEYKISDIDDADPTKYYGFLKKDGGYYILEEDTVAKTYRYYKGSSGYDIAVTGAWATRVSQTYDYFNVIF